MMRLNAYIARAGLTSRRGADELIKAGRVSVNGRKGELNDNVSDKDHIEVNDQKIGSQTYRYIVLNKPAGFVTTMSDPQGRPMVASLVRLPERVVPVGRLDHDTTGLLLLTNDGEFAHKLMHPSFKVDKVYIAEVEGVITKDKLNKLSKGIMIDTEMTAPARARQIGNNKVEMTIHEGRKHQVKKMLAAVELSVLSLHRSQYGPLTLGSLKEGSWRDLSQDELKLLK